VAKLLDIIMALQSEDRRALSAIWIERAADGSWQARCNIARDKFTGCDSAPDLEQIVSSQIGDVVIPPGIGFMAWERVEDQVYPLDLDELARDEGIRAQAAAVQDSGMIGRLDMARYDRADRSTAYLIKSHAGSQSERTRWLMGLRERPENTIYE